jgi:hypothetical protein
MNRASQSNGRLRQRTQVQVSSPGPSWSNQSRRTALASLGAFGPASILQGEPGLLSGALITPVTGRLYPVDSPETGVGGYGPWLKAITFCASTAGPIFQYLSASSGKTNSR